MTHDTMLGVGLGAVVCAVAVTGNLVRADPHLVSVYPDVVSAAVAPLAVYIAGRRRRMSGVPSGAVQAFGARVGAVAGGVFAVGLGVFTFNKFSVWPLLAFGTGTAFVSVFVLSCLAAYAAGHRRVPAAGGGPSLRPPARSMSGDSRESDAPGRQPMPRTR